MKEAVIDWVLDIQRWSNSHRLKLNAAKSEVIWLGTRQQLGKLSQSDLTLSIGESVLQPSTVVRNLGVYTDEHSIHGSQCSSLCQDMFLSPATDPSAASLCQLPHTVYTLICALILSRFDYCNSLSVCSVCKMLLPGSSVVLFPGRMHHLSWSSFTGCQCRAEYSSNCVL